ncbi:hypothetical protein Tamer19_64780 [Cupriavidus sp. TA19]|nr:hypothetical protein Tamer19_64780 [Cupriavidus sp. TA19]
MGCPFADEISPYLDSILNLIAKRGVPAILKLLTARKLDIPKLGRLHERRAVTLDRGLVCALTVLARGEHDTRTAGSGFQSEHPGLVTFDRGY